jgi:hypothetical protein
MKAATAYARADRARGVGLPWSLLISSGLRLAWAHAKAHLRGGWCESFSGRRLNEKAPRFIAGAQVYTWRLLPVVRLSDLGRTGNREASSL